MSIPSICWPNVLDNVFNMGPDTCEINMKDKDLRKNKII